MAGLTMSRYDDLTVYSITVEETGIIRYIHESREILNLSDIGDAWTFYRIKEGDELDLLAYEKCGDEAKYWIIADLNRELIEDTLDLPIGVKIIIPNEAIFRMFG